MGEEGGRLYTPTHHTLTAHDLGDRGVSATGRCVTPHSSDSAASPVLPLHACPFFSLPPTTHWHPSLLHLPAPLPLPTWMTPPHSASSGQRRRPASASLPT